MDVLNSENTHLTIDPNNVEATVSEEASATQETAAEDSEETRSRNNTEIMKRLSYAFASIAFAMIGIPLGIRAHRSEKTIGFLICLVLIAIHYTLVICVTTFSESYGARPDLLVWLPDLLFIATGAALMWRIHKYA